MVFRGWSLAQALGGRPSLEPHAAQFHQKAPSRGGLQREAFRGLPVVLELGR